MPIKRTSAILLVLAAVLSPAAPALAEKRIELPPHTHREQYLDPVTKEVIKDFEWITTPLIVVRENWVGDTWVMIRHRCIIHVDKPHPSDYHLERAKQSIDETTIRLADGHNRRYLGVDKTDGPNVWEVNTLLQHRQVLSILIEFDGFHDGWSHEWWVREATLPPDRAIAQAVAAVNAAAEQPRAARLELMGRLVGLLAPHGEADHDVAIGASLIDLERDRQELLDDRLEDHLDRIRNAVDETERARAWRELRQEMLDRSTHFMRALASSDLSEADARRLLEIVKYGSQAVDDLRDLSPQGGATSGMTRFLTYAHGVAALAEGVENQDARMIMEGLRDTVGTMEKTVRHLGVAVPSPATAIIDIPGEVAASMIDVSREGLDQATDTMKHIGAGLKGDEAALGRAVESSRRIEEILASENYGRAMESAITDRIIDKIPFLRTIVTWFKSD